MEEEEFYKISKSFKKGVPRRLKAVINDIDENPRTIDRTVGKMLEGMLLGKVADNFIGVYFGPSDYGDIFTHGIPLEATQTEIMAGHPVSTDITKVISISDLFWQAIRDIKSTSRSAYIVVIPKAYLKERTKPILYKNSDDGRYYLLPEFIKCVLPKETDGKTKRISINPSYRPTHDYKPDGLAFDTSDIPNFLETPAANKRPSIWAKIRAVIASKPFDPKSKGDHNDHSMPNGSNVAHFK